MAHHKRRKPRTQVRCTMCTDGRAGNSATKIWGRQARRQALRLPKRGQGGQGRLGWRADQAD